MTIYDYTVKRPDGTPCSLAEYKGKVLVIVNTASYCGYTKQLLGLQRIYGEYKEQGLEVLAFPANQFKAQEPDPIAKVVETYQGEYGVTFPIFDKIMVNGPDTDPLFAFLKAEIGFNPASATPEVMIPHYEEIDPDFRSNADIKWNFTKFLIDRQGNVRFRFEPEQTPSHLEDDIKALLAE